MAAPVIPPCAHRPEPHVIYDKPGSGYRGAVWCRCRKVERTSPKIRERHAQAEADALAMLQPTKTVVQPDPPPPKPRRVRKPRPKKLPAPPTPQEVNDMWRRYWRRVCAQNGYESRL